MNITVENRAEVLPRVAQIKRTTNETRIDVTVNLDGQGVSSIRTGIGFLDHMLTALSRHSGIDMTLECEGDLHVDCHHTAEDCAMVLGRAISDALGNRQGITRFGSAMVPMDEALVRVAIDLSGRPWPSIDLGFQRESIGGIATESLTHVFNTLAIELKASVHVDMLKGSNDHHKVEAGFKGLAHCLRQAIARTQSGQVLSTKGVL